MKMAQYVNQSETVTHGINAPVVNYGQIQVSKNLLDRQPVPDIDVGGRFVDALPGAVSSFGSGLINGMRANAKETKVDTTAAENEYARRVREATARYAQKGVSLVAYENEIRTLGDQYLPLIGADKVVDIAYKHSSGYLSLAEQGRKTTQTNSLNNYNQSIKDYRAKHPESITLTDEEVGNFLLRAKTTSTAAMDFNNNYKITGIDTYKQLAIDELAANIEPQLAERTKRMNRNEITTEWFQQQRQDLYGQAIDNGFTSDIAGAAIDRVFTSSWANIIAEGNSEWDRLTKEQRDTQADIIISGHKLDVLTGNPVNARLYSILGPQGYAEMFKIYAQEDENASTTAKNAMVETLNSLADSNKALTESQIDSISNHARLSGVLVKIANRKLTNGDGVANKYDAALVENTTRVVNNTTKNAEYTNPKEAGIVLKNLSSLDIEALRNKAIFMSRSEIPEMAAQGRRLMVLTEANEAGRIAAKLSLPTYNVSATGYMKLMDSSARERLRLDPNTGEFFLAKPQGLMQNSAQFVDNFTGLYETYLKDTNNFINNNTDSMSIKKQIANLLGIKEETIEDAEAYAGEPLTEIDTSGLYRDGEEGSANVGYKGMGINLQRASETTGEATGPDFSGIKNVLNRMGGSGVIRSQQPKTATATVSNSETIGGADVVMPKLMETADLSIWKDVEEYQAAQEQRTFDTEMNTLGAAMEQIESAGNPNAVSDKGARGLMQLMPDTYKDIAKRYGLPEDGIDDPEINRTAGKLYMQELKERYDNDITKTVAAYNMGPTALDKVISKYPNTWEKHLPKETENHIKKFYRALNKLTATASVTNSSVVGGASVMSSRDLARARVKEAADRNRPAEESEDVKQLRQQLDIDERKSDLQKLIEKVNDEKLIEAIREFIDRNGTDVE